MNKIDKTPLPATSNKNKIELSTRIHQWVLIILQVVMAVELILVFNEGQWINAFLVMAIMAITISPAALGRQFRVVIPPEFQLLTVLFVFAALFLGEIQSYYARIWRSFFHAVP